MYARGVSGQVFANAARLGARGVLEGREDQAATFARTRVSATGAGRKFVKKRDRRSLRESRFFDLRVGCPFRATPAVVSGCGAQNREVPASQAGDQNCTRSDYNL